MVIGKGNLKSMLGLFMGGVLSLQAYSSTFPDQIVTHPIRYKPVVTHLVPSGMTPQQIYNAYGFHGVLTGGKGQVIGIIVAYDHPRIESDLETFNKAFGLPSCTRENGCLKKIYANNKKPGTNRSWAGETALDVEWAHATAPEARILLVEAASASMQDLGHAIEVAVFHGATVVSMSWGGPEFPEQVYTDKVFRNPAVTFVASSGDDGNGASYPASSPYVLGVGGTTLHVDYSGNYISETAWSGSGGGLSAIEHWPTYQSNLPTPLAYNKRGIPDVAYNGDPQTGFSLYNSVEGSDGQAPGWQIAGGTSAGAPQWAGIIALANSTLGRNIGIHVHNLLYGIGNPSSPYRGYYFYNINMGANGTCGFHCTAQDGYDYITGLGSPQVSNLIYQLAQG